jgi:hypothetical protein
MWNRHSISRRGLAALAGATALLATTAARGQACCAGSGAVTPARLAPHEVALVGAEAKAGAVIGSYDTQARYVPSPPGAHELDLEQDLFGALRVLRRGQVALLLPFVETWRSSLGLSEAGGGIGDVNASIRYDFTVAGASRVVPGIAVLAGVTAPTGKPADAQGIGALATGATGIGAWQFNVGLAIEQAFGPWLVSATAIVAARTARTVGTVHERLAPQWTALLAAAYVFTNEWAVAAAASYALEGDATVNGKDAPGTAHRLPTLSLSAVAPLGDTWRLQGAIFDDPQISTIGLNQPADAGGSLTVVRSWM